MRRFAALLLACACAYLATKSLDATYFWDDEAEVAIFARNYLQHGALSAWDGRNLFAYANGATLDEQLVSRQPPLMFYTAALSFALFGTTTFAGRLPFALASLGALALLWRALRRDFPDQPLVWFYGVASLGLSCQFLLFARQCRYYGLVLLFCMATYHAYRAVLDGGRAGWAALLALSAAALFFSQFLLGAAFLCTLAVVHVAFFARRTSRWLFVSGAAFLALTVPYAWLHQIWVRPDFTPVPFSWSQWAPVHVAKYLLYLNRGNSLPWGIVALLALCRVPRATYVWLALAVGNMAVLAMLAPPSASTVFAKVTPVVRYIVVILPFAAGAVGVALAQLHRRHGALAALVLLLLVGTNALTLPGHAGNYLSTLPRFIRELHRPYITGDEVAARGLLEHAALGDCAAATPDYFTYPLMFYAGDRVRFCSVLNREPAWIPEPVVTSLGTPLYKGEETPRWVVQFGPENNGVDRDAYVEVARLGAYWKNTQRPEQPGHSFGPPKRYDAESEDVYLFERIR